MPRNPTSDDNDDESMDLTEVHSEPAKLHPGHHVFVGDEHNSGPYVDAEAAQAFIDGHLGGEGEVRLIDEENEE